MIILIIVEIDLVLNNLQLLKMRNEFLLVMMNDMFKCSIDFDYEVVINIIRVSVSESEFICESRVRQDLSC